MDGAADQETQREAVKYLAAAPVQLRGHYTATLQNGNLRFTYIKQTFTYLNLVRASFKSNLSLFKLWENYILYLSGDCVSKRFSHCALI